MQCLAGSLRVTQSGCGGSGPGKPGRGAAGCVAPVSFAMGCAPPPVLLPLSLAFVPTELVAFLASSGSLVLRWSCPPVSFIAAVVVLPPALAFLRCERLCSVTVRALCWCRIDLAFGAFYPQDVAATSHITWPCSLIHASFLPWFPDPSCFLEFRLARPICPDRPRVLKSVRCDLKATWI